MANLIKFESISVTEKAGLLFFLPLASGVLGRWIQGKQIYSGLDFESILCGGARAAQDQSRYAVHGDFHCDAYDAASSFIYLPWIADLGHAAVAAFGTSIVTMVWALLFTVSLAVAIYIPLLAPMSFTSRKARLPFASLITGSVVFWGNIAGLVYALMALSTYIAARRPAVFVSVVVFAGSIKQTWLTNLTVILLLDLPWWKRWTYFLIGAAAGLAPTLWFVVTANPAEVSAWADVTRYTAMVQTPGQGLLRWAQLLGLPPNSDWIIPLWIGFAAAMVIAGLGLVEHYRPSGRARVWLGLLIAVLIIPRIASYDFLLFAPGIALLLDIATREGKRLVANTVYGACVLTLIIGIADSADHAIVLVTLTSSASIMLIGLPHARMGILAVLPNRTRKADTSYSLP